VDGNEKPTGARESEPCWCRVTAVTHTLAVLQVDTKRASPCHTAVVWTTIGSTRPHNPTISFHYTHTATHC